MNRQTALSILGYGMLLGVFLVVFNLGKRAHFTGLVSTDIYALFVGFGCLVLGVAFSMVFFRHPKDKAAHREKPNLTRIESAGSGHDLSVREVDVLVFLAHGYFNKEISAHLEISENTVKFHLKNIYTKLGVANRTQAADEAKLLNII